MESPSMMTYVIGAVLVIAVVAGAWYFRSKSPQTSEVTTPTAPVATPTPSQISGLACDNQYYNPKNGFQQFYLSAQGGDVTGTNSVSCEFTAKVGDKIVATDASTSTMTAAPERNGSTFRCTTRALSLAGNVKTVVNVALKDDAGKTSSCTATFTFPQVVPQP